MFEEEFKDQMEEIKVKMERHFQHEQILKGMLKYDENRCYHQNPFLVLINECSKLNFLDEKETEFLLYMLNKYEKLGMEDYCFWSSRSKLKKPSRKKVEPTKTFSLSYIKNKKPSNQLVFDYAR